MAGHKRAIRNDQKPPGEAGGWGARESRRCEEAIKAMKKKQKGKQKKYSQTQTITMKQKKKTRGRGTAEINKGSRRNEGGENSLGFTSLGGLNTVSVARTRETRRLKKRKLFCTFSHGHGASIWGLGESSRGTHKTSKARSGREKEAIEMLSVTFCFGACSSLSFFVSLSLSLACPSSLSSLSFLFLLLLLLFSFFPAYATLVMRTKDAKGSQ